MPENKAEEFGPWIGRVLLNFAEFESVLNDLEEVVEEALCLAQSGRKARKSLWKTKPKLERITEGLDELGATKLKEKVDAIFAGILQLAELRNIVVHGQWYWNFEEGTIHTRKLHPTTRQPEHREWTVQLLRELVEEIGDAEAIIWSVYQTVRERWNNGENTPPAFFIAEVEGKEYVAVRVQPQDDPANE